MLLLPFEILPDFPLCSELNPTPPWPQIPFPTTPLALLPCWPLAGPWTNSPQDLSLLCPLGASVPLSPFPPSLRGALGRLSCNGGLSSPRGTVLPPAIPQPVD